MFWIFITIVAIAIFIITVLVNKVDLWRDRADFLRDENLDLREDISNLYIKQNKLMEQITKLEKENKDLKMSDAKNQGLYFKLVDLSNENANLKEEIERLKK